MRKDEFYMKRCLDLAYLGLGKTYPNPMVGAVIVHQGKIIGEGWHQMAGKAHAEVNAVASVKDKSLLKDSTIYINLEPCAHYGKTPPCAELIVKHQIPNVVIGCTDLFSKVSGKGIEIIEKAGAKVVVGVLEDECIKSHKRFFTFHKKKRPYIILKWAETQDGFIAPLEQKIGNPFWISSPESKKLVHKWRSEEASILIGTNTAKKDNPALTVRLWNGNQPLRILIDKNLQLKDSLKVFDDSTKTLVFTEKYNEDSRSTAFQKVDFSHLTQNLLNELYKRNIHSLIIEGGKETLQSFIDDNLWDEARVFVGVSKLENGISAPILNIKPNYKEKVSTDILSWYLNSNSVI